MPHHDHNLRVAFGPVDRAAECAVVIEAAAARVRRGCWTPDSAGSTPGEQETQHRWRFSCWLFRSALALFHSADGAIVDFVAEAASDRVGDGVGLGKFEETIDAEFSADAAEPEAAERCAVVLRHGVVVVDPGRAGA